MKPHPSRLALALALLLGLGAAQAASAADFPDGATTPSAAELQQRLAGNNFSVAYANGGSARLQFKRDGYFFVNASNNYSDNGEWRVEDGKVCTRSQKQDANCFAARIDADKLLIQRATGEILCYEPR